jgi:hypothetical protein
MYVIGSLFLRIVYIPSLGQELHPREGEIRQSASLYRSGNLASMENARSSIALQGETVL